jgi:hypothetical protein
MSQKNPDNADVFIRGESLPFLQGKESTLTADVWNRSEAVPVLIVVASAPAPPPQSFDGIGTFRTDRIRSRRTSW